MTMLTFDILAETLFSGEIAGERGSFAHQVDRLFETWAASTRSTSSGRWNWCAAHHPSSGGALRWPFPYRGIVADTMEMRRAKMGQDPDGVPGGLPDPAVCRAEGPEGLTPWRGRGQHHHLHRRRPRDDGPRGLGWAIYCLSQAPWSRERIEVEIDRVLPITPDPTEWLDAMPLTRAAFEEAMRLYPPAPSINREAIEPDR